jgi:hypothetical protein
MRKEDKSTEIYGAATGQHTIVHVREREREEEEAGLVCN